MIHSRGVYLLCLGVLFYFGAFQRTTCRFFPEIKVRYQITSGSGSNAPSIISSNLTIATCHSKA
jgi:hypothetical protein